MDYHFEEEWPTNTDISDWNAARGVLNIIIRKFNKWQIKGCPPEKKAKLLGRIEFGIQTIGAQEGGGGYLETLVRMRDFINKK